MCNSSDLGEAGGGRGVVSTLTKPAGIALAAAFFIHDRCFTALGAQVSDAHFLEDGFIFDRVYSSVAVSVGFPLIRAASLVFHHGQGTGFLAQVHIQHLSDAIRQ